MFLLRSNPQPCQGRDLLRVTFTGGVAVAAAHVGGPRAPHRQPARRRPGGSGVLRAAGARPSDCGGHDPGAGGGLGERYRLARDSGRVFRFSGDS